MKNPFGEQTPCMPRHSHYVWTYDKSVAMFHGQLHDPKGLQDDKSESMFTGF